MTAIKHRRMNTVIGLLAIIMMGLVAYNMNHDIQDCEERLFEKLTNIKAPVLKNIK